MKPSVNLACLSAMAFVLAQLGMPTVLGYIVEGDGQLSFVNEVSIVQIAYAESAKRLDCAAVNFSDITWYKDGMPFPRKPREDTLTHHLEDNGQFLHFKSADFADEGEYVCVVSNKERRINRTIRFVVLEKSRNDPPVFLGENEGHCADQTVAVGGTVRFNCKFSVGKDQAAQSYAGWLKVSSTGKEKPVEWIDDIKTHTRQTNRNGNIIVADLKIVDVKENAFGIWKVYVYNDGYQTEAALTVRRRQEKDSRSYLEKIIKPMKRTF